MGDASAAEPEHAGKRRGGAIGDAAAVLFGALMLSWPALYNGFPLLYPDSMTYLDDGRIVARAVFLHQLSDYYGMRSFFYSLGILPFHWNISPWPIVALQSLLVAWVLWLVVRTVATRRTVRCYLVIVFLLSMLTGVSWYSAFIMPDILGPLVYLSIYLLVFAPETLSRAERFSLYPIAVWGITAHTTHLMLAAGLWLLLVLFAAFERRHLRYRLRSLAEVAALLAVAAGAQLALHGYLYGKPSLNGEHPPYLMARILGDGTGRKYLDQHCPQVQWAICKHLGQLSGDSDDFLWGPDGAFASASDDDQQLMSQQEMPFVLATVRAYPREQLAASAANFWGQLRSFGIYGFDPSPYILDNFATTLPRARASYSASRQARGTLQLDLLTDVQLWTVLPSLGIIAVSIPLLWRRYSLRLAGLSLVVISIVLANAFVSGVLSVVDDRYGCRVIWLIPLLAAIFILDVLNRWKTPKGTGIEGRQVKET
ncbi:MAG: hypothetical protein ABSF28_03120 [Terracidiphilus sp.]|jgi:hypothetical protein